MIANEVTMPLISMAAAVQPSDARRRQGQATEYRGKIVYDFSLGEPTSTLLHICDAA